MFNHGIVLLFSLSSWDFHESILYSILFAGMLAQITVDGEVIQPLRMIRGGLDEAHKALDLLHCFAMQLMLNHAGILVCNLFRDADELQECKDRVVSILDDSSDLLAF